METSQSVSCDVTDLLQRLEEISKRLDEVEKELERKEREIEELGDILEDHRPRLSVLEGCVGSMRASLQEKKNL